jgi:hypothetical protein
MVVVEQEIQAEKKNSSRVDRYQCSADKDKCSSLQSRRSLISQALVTHACNPSYSGGRDQKDHSSKPTQANSLQDPI